jgi:transcriptional regulator with GAF, ATPase, and Fis domain
MTPMPDDTLERQIAELDRLYGIARDLIGARDREQFARWLVRSGMGATGAQSGAAFRVQERGRFALLYGTLPEAVPGERIAVPDTAREFLQREGVCVLRSASAARGLGKLRDALVEEWDAAVAVAVPDANGLVGLLLFGARPEDLAWRDEDLSLLQSLAGFAARGFTALAGSDTIRDGVRGRGRPARTFEALRKEHPALEPLVGESAALFETCQELVAVAPTRFPVMLLGESGVGKELAARAVHDLSDRASGPFETVDCGSIPRELIESELFGHVKGSFTGAHRDRRGAFDLAHRGTLFLDEIGEMPMQLQTRLLRVLQEGRFRRVGDETPIDVDVRVVAATNRDLQKEVTAGRFREDLFYRLNVYTVRVPALRDRPDDLPMLVEHFIEKHGRDAGVRRWSIEPEVVAALSRHRWPGNVRELGNLAASLTVRARGTGRVGMDDLEAVWRRQHGADAAMPWRGSGADGAGAGSRGAWVLELARQHRFNLVEAARTLQKRKRAGEKLPVAERSALSYYLTGEILRALSENDGDVARAAELIAGSRDAARYVEARTRKVAEAVSECRGDRAKLRARFAKLPGEYVDQ